MTKFTYYTYLGTNGTLTTPIHLKDIYSIKTYLLVASDNKLLTKDGINTCKSIEISEEELDQWYEIDDPNGQL